MEVKSKKYEYELNPNSYRIYIHQSFANDNPFIDQHGRLALRLIDKNKNKFCLHNFL